jgi:hypothetical protein
MHLRCEIKMRSPLPGDKIDILPLLIRLHTIRPPRRYAGMFQVGRKWQPYRTASRYVPLESTQNQDSWSLIGPSFKWLSILGPRATFEASLQRGGYWWPDVPWTTDVRKQDITTTATRGAFLETDRTPRRWQYGGTFTYFAELWGRSHELETDTWVGATFSRPRISGIRISSSTVTAA